MSPATGQALHPRSARPIAKIDRGRRIWDGTDRGILTGFGVERVLKTPLLTKHMGRDSVTRGAREDEFPVGLFRGLIAMDRHFACCVAAAALIGAAVEAVGQTVPTARTETFAPFVGEVTGTDVYVRSGPSTNFYPVTKLSAGHRVTVTGEESGWYAVTPPEGCYSLIHKNYVDVEDGKTGVVNGDAVRVRAGSELTEYRYATQLKLDRGAAVTIVAADDDDYLRIVPPEGARLYIHSQFVRPVPEAEQASDATVQADASQTATVLRPEAKTVSLAARASQPEELQQIEVDLEGEMSKPLHQRDYEGLTARYQAFADEARRKHGVYVATYARSRLAQLKRAAAMRASSVQLRELGEELTTWRKDALVARKNLRPPVVEIGGGFDATGELRASMIYAFTSGPRRYRLIDRDASSLRTICYVEIPADSNIDINRFLGRQVGVRAREQKIETGDVNPVPVLVAAELVVLDTAPRPRPEGDGATGGAAGDADE